MAAPSDLTDAEQEELRTLMAALDHTDVPMAHITPSQPLALLGSGSFGVVYRGTLQGTPGPVAVKSMNLSHVKELQFMREVQAMRKLVDEANVVRLLTWCRLPRVIVLELMDSTLSAFIRNKQNNISWRQRVKLALDLCSAIKAAHNKGVFHRDVKPSNCLVKARPVLTLKVADFGQSYVKTRVDDATTMHKGVEGSERYKSPELHNYEKPAAKHERTPEQQAAMKDFYRRADMWAVGGTLHFIITGKDLFYTVQTQHISHHMTGPDTQQKLLLDHLSQELPDGCPPPLFSCMLQCISLRPEQRPTAERLVDVINDVLQEMPDEPASAAAGDGSAAFAVPAHGDDTASTTAASGDGPSSSQNSRFEGHTGSSTASTATLPTPSRAGPGLGDAAYSPHKHHLSPDKSDLEEPEPTWGSATTEVFDGVVRATRVVVAGIGWVVSRFSSSTSNGDQSQPAAASSASSSSAAAASSAAASSAAAAGPASAAAAFSSRHSHGSPRHASDASTSPTHPLMSAAVPFTPPPSMRAPTPQGPPAFNPHVEAHTLSPASTKRSHSIMRNSMSPPAACTSPSAASSSRMHVVDETPESAGHAAPASSAAAAAAAMGTRARPLEIDGDSEVDEQLPENSPLRRLRARTVSGGLWEADGVSPAAPLSPEQMAFAQGAQAAAAAIVSRTSHGRAASESQAGRAAPAAAAAAASSSHARRSSGTGSPAARRQ